MRNIASLLTLVGGKVTVLPVTNDPADVRAKVKAALASDGTVDTVLALGAGTAGEPTVAAVKDAGKTGAVRVATFDMSAGFLKSIASGEAAFAIGFLIFLVFALAFLINAYNAFTLRAIVDSEHGRPEESAAG